MIRMIHRTFPDIQKSQVLDVGIFMHIASPKGKSIAASLENLLKPHSYAK